MLGFAYQMTVTCHTSKKNLRLLYSYFNDSMRYINLLTYLLTLFPRM